MKFLDKLRNNTRKSIRKMSKQVMNIVLSDEADIKEAKKDGIPVIKVVKEDDKKESTAKETIGLLAALAIVGVIVSKIAKVAFSFVKKIFGGRKKKFDDSMEKASEFWYKLGKLDGIMSTLNEKETNSNV